MTDNATGATQTAGSAPQAGDATSKNSPSAVVHTTTEKSESKMYDEHYVKSLVEENIKWRKRANDDRDSITKIQEETKKLIEESQSKSKQYVENLKQISDERIKKAEIKAIAVEMGLKKMDYLKLADFSSVTISEDGEVVGVREILESFKQNEPEFFKMLTTTNANLTNTSATPTLSEELKAKRSSILAMSKEEFAKAQSDFLRSCR